MKKSINNLKEYIEQDEIYQDYKKGIEPYHNDGNTDFEWFCIGHCKDIENVINELENLKQIEKEHQIINGKLREENQELRADYGTKAQVERDLLKEKNKKYKEAIDKAIEFIEWFRKDNMEYYKNKGVALTISECDGLLKILEGNSNE